LHTSTGIAFISVKLSTNVDCSSIVSASARVVGTFNLSSSLTSASVAGILGRRSLGECLPEIVGHAVVSTVAWVVCAGDLSIGLTCASVATIGSGLSDSQSRALVLALAWDWIGLAVDISVLHALASVASISFVEGCANLDGSAVVVARADFIVADDVGVVVALAGLAAIQMGDIGFSDGVLLSVVVAFTLLGVASDHAGLEASTSVASVGVDPG